MAFLTLRSYNRIRNPQSVVYLIGIIGLLISTIFLLCGCDNKRRNIFYFGLGLLVLVSIFLIVNGIFISNIYPSISRIQIILSIIALIIAFISFILNKYQWASDLSYIEDRQDYIPISRSGEIRNRPFPYHEINTVKSEINFRSKYLICDICNHKNDISNIVCASCNTKFNRCPICKHPISKEDLVFCPFCNSSFHKTEFLEWLKIYANCPRCKKELDMWEFQKYLEESKSELSQIQCSACKKLIPIDCKYCIFCGARI